MHNQNIIEQLNKIIKTFKVSAMKDSFTASIPATDDYPLFEELSYDIYKTGYNDGIDFILDQISKIQLN